jgi:predicted metal-dependent hydrolase
MQMDARFLQGIEEFNRQFFFEAHDLWEEIWVDTTGNDRLFYQGLIQTAVGFYHLSNGNLKGANSQFTKALAKLEQYLPDHHGVDVQHLVNAVRTCRHDTEAMREGILARFDETKIPQIQLSSI